MFGVMFSVVNMLLSVDELASLLGYSQLVFYFI